MQMTPERAAEIKNKIAEFETKYGIKLSPELLKIGQVELSNTDPVTWGMAHRALKGEPYRFELPEFSRSNSKLWNRHRPFLKQMLQDQAQNKCYEKSRQCGASESSVTEVLWFLDAHPGTKALYVFPTTQQMQDFSNSRIAAALEETPYMAALIGSTDNVGLKKIGRNSYLFMRSGQTGRLGEGIDADALFVDEKDRMSDKIEAAFEQSLSSSAYKLLREFSTPTLPGVGVDKSFQASCQYYWHVKCDSGHWQTLTYPDNIGQNWEHDKTQDVVKPGTFYLKCSKEKCSSTINRWSGEWVAKYDDHRKQTHAGYHINQLSCIWISPDQIMQQMYKYRFQDVFYNYVLGMPYSSQDGLITQEALLGCLDATRWFPGCRRQEYTAVVAGIDWGYMNWCVVLGRRLDGKYEICGLKYVDDTADVLSAAKLLADYLRPFEPNVIVADLGYGRDRCMELLRQFPDKVFACTYTTGNVTDKTFNPTWSEQQYRVSVNRTAHLRNSLELIKMRKFSFPGQLDDYQLFFKHLLNLALIHIEEEDPETRDVDIVEKIGKKGDDHYAHAFAYACLAMEKITQGGTLHWEFLQTS
jgi:hypothetical protein